MGINKKSDNAYTWKCDKRGCRQNGLASSKESAQRQLDNHKCG